jgi:hydrogenase/urease accessory protein HupE
MKRPRAARARRSPALLLALAAAFLALFAVAEARAHEVGLSRGEYALSGATVSATLTFARRDAIELCAGLDEDHDGKLTAEEIARAQGALEQTIVGRVKVRGDDAKCPGTLTAAALAEEDGLTVRAEYRCPTAPREATIELALLSDLPFGHRHLARSDKGGAPADALLSERSRSLSITAGPAPPGPEAGQAPAYGGKLSFLLLGVEHILKGYDHLVFLLGLVLVGGRLRSLVGVITAFTVAHSITLAVAVLGVWAPSPRIVEPAIALSIAYVGVENFFVKDAEKRYRITFPFGLVHGFGFAGALQEIAMPRADVPAALVLFNLGVEAGQLAVLALLLPLVLAARKRASFRERGVKVVSAAIVALGLVWFVSRALGG